MTDGIGVVFVAGVFVSFMSGNTTSTGVAIGTANGAQFAHVAVTVPLFVLGIVVGAVIVRRSSGRRIVFALAAMILVGFLVWKLLAPATQPDATSPLELVDLALLIPPMGMLATTLRAVGPRSVGIGYVTGTLVSFGESVASLIGAGTRDWPGIRLYGGLWVSFLLGAALGAFGATRLGPWAVLGPVITLAALAALPARAASTAESLH